MAANEITTSGFPEFTQKLASAPAEVLELTDEAAEYAATTWEELAKLAAPVDFGFLRGGISHHQVKQNDWEVTSSRFYSPYQEWGTITHVAVPPDLSNYAIQFKGKGIRKTGGVIPHPFFFVQKPAVEKQFLADLETVMNTPL